MITQRRALSLVKAVFRYTLCAHHTSSVQLSMYSRSLAHPQKLMTRDVRINECASDYSDLKESQLVWRGFIFTARQHSIAMQSAVIALVGMSSVHHASSCIVL